MFLTLRAALRTLPHELIEAALAGGARPAEVLRTIVLPLMTPPLLAGIALCFVSCLGNFGIPALLGIPGNYVVLPTLIYQRLAGFGPSVLSDVAVLSLLIGAIAVLGIVAQDALLRAATFASARRRSPRGHSNCGAGACRSRSRLWSLLVAHARASAHGTRVDVARARGRRSARRAYRDAGQLPLRAVRARGGPARVRQQLRAVGDRRGRRSC